ncbi:cell envelope biogenesis protein TolA [Bartonella alsatica]|uniref:cell envelope biogenesis protein TolA n=1 Tax=Bartonella alsatica TaxID=52764 RepID=UPI001ABAB322|nr:cell envelope biogenesis protein TolA [Bartonella alsatica]
MNKDSYHSMKRGLALSLAAHVFLFTVGGAHFIRPVSLPQQSEVIPITLAPLTQEFSSQQGALDAPVRAIPAVKPTNNTQEKEDAHHFGEGQLDNLAPFRRKEKPKLVETIPPSSAKKEVSEKPSPELKEQELSDVKRETPLESSQEGTSKVIPEPSLEKPQKDVLQELSDVKKETPLESSQGRTSKVIPEPSLEKPQKDVLQELSDVKKETPLESSQERTSKVIPDSSLEMLKNEKVISPQELTQTVQKAPMEQTKIHPQTPKVALPEKFLFPQFKPKPVKESTVQNAQVLKKKKQQMKNQTVEDILAMEENNLLNRARTQGGGAKRSSTPEALGARKNIDNTTKMAQTLVTIAGGCIQRKLKLVALGGDLKNRPVVRLRFYLNREGMVIGDPVIDPLSGAESQQAIMIRQVYAAVFSCQPYADLPRDQYNLWGQGFDFNVDPLQETIR